MRKVVIGSRASALAITQTEWFIDKMKQAGAPFEFEIKKIKTKGDKILDVTLSKVGGKGLFVKEIEQAMFDKEIDMAVHSMKDMPAEIPEGLMIGCIPEREDHRDAFISKSRKPLRDLPSGAVVGTSSLRRGAQVLSVRPDLEIKWIRGNIGTRIDKMKNEEFDAIILAAAGLSRMGWSEEIVTEFLDPEICVPAVGQGALAIECREDDSELLEVLSKVTDETVAKAVEAERTFLHRMEGSCQVPIAGYAHWTGENELKFTALVASPDGKTILKETLYGSDPVALGDEAATILNKQGAKEIVDKVKRELEQ